MKKQTKLSIRTVFVIIIIVAIILGTVSMAFAFILQKRVNKMQADTLRHNQCVALADQLETGSHSLTIYARNFAANNFAANDDYDYSYFVDYWHLAKVEKPRTKAVNAMKQLGITAEEEAHIDLALETSNDLIESEKVAMLCILRSDGLVRSDDLDESVRLILNRVAQENPDCYWIDTATCEDILDSDKSEEWAMYFAGEDLTTYTDEQYADKAISILFSDQYNAARESIMYNIETFGETVTMRMEDDMDRSVKSFKAMLIAVVVILAVMLVFMVSIILILYFLLIKPIISIQHSLDGNADLSTFRTSELQALASNYNRSKEGFTAITKELELQMNIYREQSRRDYLTNLANREMLDEYLTGMFSGDPSSFLLFIIDADDFKNVNDTYGHTAGDVVLKTISKIFKGVAFKYHGIAARYGGEEFVVIATGVTELFADAIANEILEKTRRAKISYEDKEISITVSIGSCYSLGKDVTVDNIVKKADEALYVSKSSGKDCHTVYNVA